jgi:hypothetical protein
VSKYVSFVACRRIYFTLKLTGTSKWDTFNCILIGKLLYDIEIWRYVEGKGIIPNIQKVRHLGKELLLIMTLKRG